MRAKRGPRLPGEERRDKYQRIVGLRKSGLSCSVIAKRIGMTEHSVRLILKKETEKK